VEIAKSTPDLVQLTKQTRELILASKSPATRRAYLSDWRGFQVWCIEHCLPDLPASSDTVALYLGDVSKHYKPASLNRKLTAINQAHRASGFRAPATRDHPEVADTLQGIRRIKGTLQIGKTPLLGADVKKMIQYLPNTLKGVRDRAILLIGFSGAFRRSELATLTVADIVLTDLGLVVTLRKSKTDQEGQGRKVALLKGRTPETCPLTAWSCWLKDSGLIEGSAFRSINRHGKLTGMGLHQDSIGLIVKSCAKAAGFDPAFYAGHSLRSGHATQAYLNGATELAIMRQTGHRSIATVRRYIRDLDIFEDNPAAKLGL